MKKLLIGLGIVALATSCKVVTPGIATGNEGLETVVLEEKTFLGIGSVNIGAIEAAEKAGFTKVASIDYSRSGLFVVRYKVIVTGTK